MNPGTDPFTAYAARANTIVSQPAALLGSIKLRAAARVRYSEIVAEMGACESAAALETYLASINPTVVQFAAELPFLWLGDGDFPSLKHEIERARARFDAGLDFPRWEPS